MPSPQAVTAARVTAALKPALSDAVAAAIVADSADPAAFVAKELLKCPAQTTSERPSESESPSSEPVGGADDPEPDRDHADVPRPQPTTELLLPAGWPATFHDRFSLLVSRHAFDGWAAQPSPCCGAASVAGACNAALGLALLVRGLPPPRAHPPGVLSQVRSSSPVGGEPVGSDREPAGAPLEGIADGKGVADDAPLVGDKARTA